VLAPRWLLGWIPLWREGGGRKQSPALPVAIVVIVVVVFVIAIGWPQRYLTVECVEEWR